MADGDLSGGYFLSYSRTDERFALRFAKDLRARGIPMWVDQLDIRPSEHWDRAVEKAVRDCRGLVVILSPRSVASDNVADEISYAIENRKPVLPVMIEKCSLPLRVTRMHVLDASANYERALEQCVAEIQRAGGETRPEEKPQAAAPLDPEIIATATRHLAGIIGPIAKIVVQKAASRASSAAELNALLTQHIENPTDRARFVALTGGAQGSPSPPPSNAPATAGEPPLAGAQIDTAEVERAGQALMRFNGPIAPIIVRREAKAGGSLNDFHQRLAALVADPRERAEFLKVLKPK